MKRSEAIADLEARKKMLQSSCMNCWDDAIEMALQALKADAVPIKWLYEQSDNPLRTDKFRNACDFVAVTWLAEKEEE